jgi:hypothetical protein
VAHALAGRRGLAGDEAATGFFTLSLMNWAARSSASPPISPIMMIELGARIVGNSASTSMKSVPFTGSPPMPTQVDWPRPSVESWCTAS